jgi:hypothetical protein
MRFPFVRRKKYDEVVYKLETLLCHATGGKLSKHTYTLQTMESVVTDYVQECCDEASVEGGKNVAEEIIAELEHYCTHERTRTLMGLITDFKKKYAEGQT